MTDKTLQTSSLFRRRGRRERLSRKLFSLIALCDTLTNSYPTLHFLTFICLPRMYDVYNIPVTDPAGITILAGFFLICTCGCVSQVSTAMLAVTRLICIVNPFYRVSSTLVTGYIKVYSLIMASLNLSTMFCKILPAPKGLGPNLSRVCLILNVSQCLLGVCASLFTVGRMVSRRRLTERRPDEKIRSSLTIMLMNLPYLVSVVMILVTLVGISGVRFALLTFPTVACFTSMLNPLTILLLNQKARQYAKLSLIKREHSVLSRVSECNNKPLVNTPQGSDVTTGQIPMLGQVRNDHDVVKEDRERFLVRDDDNGQVGEHSSSRD